MSCAAGPVTMTWAIMDSSTGFRFCAELSVELVEVPRVTRTPSIYALLNGLAFLVLPIQ